MTSTHLEPVELSAGAVAVLAALARRADRTGLTTPTTTADLALELRVARTRVSVFLDELLVDGRAVLASGGRFWLSRPRDADASCASRDDGPFDD